MAAYHWEARRKQFMLDRQMVLQARAACDIRRQQEAAGKVPPKQPHPPYPDKEAEHPAPQDKKRVTQDSCHRREGPTESRCPCNTQHVPNHSGKLLKRYSDFEYSQQW